MSNRKKTRRQKKEENPKGTGQSKYAKKVQRRRRLANRLGVDPALPMPVLKMIRDNQDGEDNSD